MPRLRPVPDLRELVIRLAEYCQNDFWQTVELSELRLEDSTVKRKDPRTVPTVAIPAQNRPLGM